MNRHVFSLPCQFITELLYFSALPLILLLLPFLPQAIAPFALTYSSLADPFPHTPTELSSSVFCHRFVLFLSLPVPSRPVQSSVPCHMSSISIQTYSSCSISLFTESHLNIYYSSIPQYVCSNISRWSPPLPTNHHHSHVLLATTIHSPPSSTTPTETTDYPQRVALGKTRIYILSVAHRCHIETIYPNEEEAMSSWPSFSLPHRQ